MYLDPGYDYCTSVVRSTYHRTPGASARWIPILYRAQTDMIGVRHWEHLTMLSDGVGTRAIAVQIARNFAESHVIPYLTPTELRKGAGLHVNRT